MSYRSSCQVSSALRISLRLIPYLYIDRKRENTKAKFNNLRDRIQWFKDQLNPSQTQLSKTEIHALIQLLVDIFLSCFSVFFTNI